MTNREDKLEVGGQAITGAEKELRREERKSQMTEVETLLDN